MFRLKLLLLIAIGILFQNEAYAECDYSFSGQVLVQHNGVTWPLRNAKVRVKRKNGTGAGRNFVRTDDSGNFSGVWRFDRDQNGRLPGGGDINFAIQLQLQDDDRLKVGKGGWFNTPWDTFKEAAGKGCTRFIWTEPVVINADGKRSHTNTLPNRAFIYAVHEELLRNLERQGVGLKNRIEVIYPDKHVYNISNSYFIHKSHIQDTSWDRVITLIHETMHQWTVNWMRGAESPGCVADAHHKSPDKWNSARCSGFMEGFAEATALALYEEIFRSKPFFSGGTNKDIDMPMTLEELRREYDGAIQKGDDAERSDEGWENFIKFIMWQDEWEVFDPANNPDLYVTSCNPTDVTIYPLLKALKAENPRHDGRRARFAWMMDILERRAAGIDEWDKQFYQALGDPATDPVALQKKMCPAADRLLNPLKRPAIEDIKKNIPLRKKQG